MCRKVSSRKGVRYVIKKRKVSVEIRMHEGKKKNSGEFKTKNVEYIAPHHAK